MITEQELELAIKSLQSKADAEGYKTTKNLPNIAKAKLRAFGLGEIFRCPCDPNSDRACISDHCRQDIEADGVCHCHLFEKKEVK